VEVEVKFMKKPISAQLAVGFVSLILGLALAGQFKNVQKVGGNVSVQRTEQLTAEIKKLREDNEELLKQIQEYEDIIEKYERAAEEEGSDYQALINELSKAKMQAGLLPMEGPGVVVTVDNLYINDINGGGQIVQAVHYEDILKLVNELNAAGAEAIAINDERVVATTEIRNAGDYIVINTNRHSVPFEIKAIGNPENLEAALKLLGGVVDNLGEILDIKIRREDKLTIPGYDGIINYKFAQPLQDKKS